MNAAGWIVLGIILLFCAVAFGLILASIAKKR